MKANKRFSNYISTLKQQLVEFGLDPKEWHIVPLRNQRLFVIHKEDKQFSMLGTWDGRSRWTGLQILSL